MDSCPSTFFLSKKVLLKETVVTDIQRIARRKVNVTNVRAKHFWVDIRTNSTRCLWKIHYWTANHTITAMFLLFPFSVFHQIIPVTASDFVLCLSEIQPPNALRAAVNIYF